MHVEIQEKLDSTLTNLVSLIFALFLGTFCTYVRLLPTNSIQYFSSFLFYVCLPLLLFVEVATATFESYLQVLTVLGIMIGANLLMFFISGACATIWHRSWKTGAMLGLCTTFSSSIFLSMPIVKTLDRINSPQTSFAVYCSLAFFLWDVTLVPISVLIFEVRQRNRKKRNGYFVRCSVGILRALLNPITLPIAVGMIFFTIKEITGIQVIPSMFLTAFGFLGDISGPLSIFIMGMGINGKELLGSSLFESIVLILLKQCVMPLMVVGGLFAAGFRDKNLLTSLYLTNASPPAQTIFLLSIQYGNVALLQVSSCLVLGVFFFFPQLYLSISFFQLDWYDLITPVNLKSENLIFLLRRSNIIMNACTIFCGILTLTPFILNSNYRVKLRRCVGTLTLGQIGASIFFMLPAIATQIPKNRVLCTIQGFGLQFFVSFSNTWFLFTSTQMVMDFVFSWSGGVFRELGYHICAVVTAGITASIPLFWDEGYAESGAPWCWVANPYLQFALLYIPFLLFAFIGFVNIGLIQIAERLRRSRNRKLELPESFKKAKAALLLKCRLFVIGFSFVWIFGVINRLTQLIRGKIADEDASKAYFLPLWLHVIFSCGQGLLTFLIFATGSQIMKDYRTFARKIIHPLKYITRIPELLTGRGGSYGITGGTGDVNKDNEEVDEDDDEPATFLFSPSVMRRYSVAVTRASALTDFRNRKNDSPHGLRRGLLSSDFESLRDTEMGNVLKPESIASPRRAALDDRQLKEVSSDEDSSDDENDAALA